MQNEQSQLKVFGFGLALFISFIIMMHSIHHGLSFLSFVLVVVGLLFVLAKVEKWPAAYFLVLAGVYYMLFTGEPKHALGPVALSFLGLGVVFLGITLIKAELLKPVYDKWMIVAHWIGVIITTIILSVFYYVVFGVVGIILRILRKDLLHQRLDKSAKSYWIKREEKITKESYERQF